MTNQIINYFLASFNILNCWKKQSMKLTDFEFQRRRSDAVVLHDDKTQVPSFNAATNLFS